MRGLLIEPDPSLAKTLGAMFAQEGLSATHVETGSAALSSLQDADPGFIVLDASLPDMDGLSLLRRVRERSGAPLIAVGTTKQEEERIVMTVRMLRAGADDFLAKPFFHEELLLRTRAVLRRAMLREAKEFCYSHGGLEHWPGRQTKVHGTLVPLPKNQSEILDLLVARQGRPLGESEYRSLTGREWSESRLLHVQVHKIRRALSAIPGGRPYIETYRGQGVFLPRARA